MVGFHQTILMEDFGVAKAIHLWVGGHDNTKIGFWNQGWRMSVLNNGNIGIGTTTPNYRLSFGNLSNFKSLAMYESGGEFYGLGISGYSFDFWIGNPSASYSFRNPSGAVVVAITSIGDIFQNNSYARNYYYNTSDRRLKNNIVSIDKALDKIAALRGIHYELKDSVDAAFFENTVANADTSKNNKKTPNSSKKTAYGASAPSKTTFGFVAQEIETVLPELVTTSASSVKSVNYIGVIPILVEAMREQQTQIESLKAEVKKLKNTKAGARTEDAKSSTEKTTSIAYLYQNTPNPFSQETTIKYSLPETVQDAFISITDLNGKQLKTLTIATKGESSVVLKANELYAGLFVYTLVADGNIVDSKRMVIVE
ncbi:MAG: T9SS C-terminal target domain-containing protein [Bacteroidetes bacterium]|nr:MAG: T9SS C-terminal target domain-containing protein [Bacteroidota bacterium]